MPVISATPLSCTPLSCTPIAARAVGAAEQTWGEAMVESLRARYLSMDAWLNANPAVETELLARMQPGEYLHTTFGPPGQNKTECDFLFVLTATGDITSGGTITKSGDALRWDIDGSVYTQDNLPAHTLGAGDGIITVSTTDGRDGVTAISIISKLIAGDISFVAALTNATHLQIESCDAELDVAALQNNTALERLFLNNTLAYGDGGAAFAPLVNLLTLQYHTTDVATDISELATLTKLTNLRINDTPATGDIVSLYVLSDLTAIIVSRTDIGCSSGVMNWPAIRSISLDNSWTQPEVDAFVNALYILWVSGLTYATPTCYIGGSNAAPSGTYQAANPPTTPLEKIYTMVNDNTSTGNNTFSSFTYTTP